MYLCLDCRACETACPSHVEFGDLMERARGQIERQVPRPWYERWLRHLVFAELFPHPQRLALLLQVLDWYQRSGLQGLLRDMRVFAALPRASATPGSHVTACTETIVHPQCASAYSRPPTGAPGVSGFLLVV